MKCLWHIPERDKKDDLLEGKRPGPAEKVTTSP
jgi:hypothetical protein